MPHFCQRSITTSACSHTRAQPDHAPSTPSALLTTASQARHAPRLATQDPYRESLSRPRFLHRLQTVPEHRPPEFNVNINVRSAVGIVLFLVIILVVAVLALTSYYTVGADSQGVVLRFGKYLKTVEPGLHFKLPFGVDAVTVIPTRRQLKLEFGFTTPGYLTNAIQPSQNPVEEKSMVTGDLNAALVEWVVQYRIDDPSQYLFDVRNPGETLRDLSEAAMREVVGDRTVDELITLCRQDIEIEALARMQELAKDYHLRSRVDQVQSKNVTTPDQTQATLHEANKAQQARE